ncbi:hypothetical protein AVEN_268987-1 [Araneus ventricosus]|uniref:Uncharacterized protein n=1 Tax=Araneus ventricosus TaxID=182803 RepID=A0A4Y2HJ68_ARAVE|nr:hypothetical protein AVEN_268987-1 [Araneus ventricosus]
MGAQAATGCWKISAMRNTNVGHLPLKVNQVCNLPSYIGAKVGLLPQVIARYAKVALTNRRSYISPLSWISLTLDIVGLINKEETKLT